MSYPSMLDVSFQLAWPTTVHAVPWYFISESPCPATREKPRPIDMLLIWAMPAAVSWGALSLLSQAPFVLVTTVGLVNFTWCDQLHAALVVGSAQFAGAAPVRLTAGQRYIRGLYSGGTFCYEATLLLGRMLGKTGARVWSNAPVNKDDALTDVWHSREHTIIDLGDDIFTRGRPHPMIDHRLRNERLLVEANDAEVAVILFDVVLGYGSHPDPAGEVVTAIRAARARAAKNKRQVAFVGFVCGTPGDPQDLTKQEATLRAAGVELAASNAAAVRAAAAIVAHTTAARPTRKQGARR